MLLVQAFMLKTHYVRQPTGLQSKLGCISFMCRAAERRGPRPLTATIGK